MIVGGDSDPIGGRLAGMASEYADQNERDYRRFVTAVKEGRIEAIADV
jgi:hypothetical protein